MNKSRFFQRQLTAHTCLHSQNIQDRLEAGEIELYHDGIQVVNIVRKSLCYEITFASGGKMDIHPLSYLTIKEN